MSALDARKPKVGVCPCCGQRMLIRHGVQLPPKQADIFDMIEHSGARGVPSEVLASVFYPDKSDADGRNCVKANVWKINSRLGETDVQVKIGGRREPYRVVKVRVREA